MTLPDERYRAVMWASRFLQDLAHDYKKYPRVSKSIRGEALAISRHFPNGWDMQRAANEAPDVFQEKMEPLYRMVAAYKQSNQEPTE